MMPAGDCRGAVYRCEASHREFSADTLSTAAIHIDTGFAFRQMMRPIIARDTGDDIFAPLYAIDFVMFNEFLAISEC